LAIVFALATTIATSQQSASGQADDYVRKRMTEMRIPGLSLAVVKRGVILKATGYGLANLETNTPATPETEYRIASISKQFVATAIMLLVQENMVRLDDPVSKYLDGPPGSWKEITIYHLLTHTSGIVRDPIDYHPYDEQSITDVIKAAYSLPLSFPPGEKWLYSNVGYYVLAEVITKASGQPWDTFISERLLAPAHMTSTRVGTVTDIVPHRASGYKQISKGIANAENWIAVRPSSAFLSTVLDLAKWDRYLYSSNPLSNSNRKLMWTPVTLNDKTSADYGFGWYVDTFLGRVRIHHDGQYPGFRSDFERFTDDKLTVIVLANSDGSSLDSLAIKIAGFYETKLSTPPFTLSADVPPQAVAGNPVAIRITAKDDGKGAPDSLVEMEIWDESGNTVYKQHKADETFDAGQTNTYVFSWTPTKAGRYTVNVGAYGPKWTLSYAWKQKAATINAN
jgi:CubicO group peptidase (beta-lactamase class C family)